MRNSFNLIFNFIEGFYKTNKDGIDYKTIVVNWLFKCMGVCAVIGIIIFYLSGEIKVFIIIIGLFIFYMLFEALITSIDISLKWLPKIVRGRSKSFRELFNSFTHGGYLLGITFFSLYTSVYFSLIVMFIFQWIFKIRIDLDLTNIFFMCSTIFTIYYFMFHVIRNELSIKVVSIRVQLYVTWSVTISFILAALSIKNILISFITWHGIGFSWLAYFLRKVELEDELLKDMNKINNSK